MSEDRGMKYDEGKLLGAVIFQDFPLAIQKVLAVSTFGAEKYARHSWRDVPDLETRYDDARGRHFLWSFLEDEDPESGVSHLAHEAWNCLALLQVELEKRQSE